MIVHFIMRICIEKHIDGLSNLAFIFLHDFFSMLSLCIVVMIRRLVFQISSLGKIFYEFPQYSFSLSFYSFVRETMESTGVCRKPLSESTPSQKRTNSLPSNIMPQKLVKVEHFSSKSMFNFNELVFYCFALGKTEYCETRNIHFLFCAHMFFDTTERKFFFSF